MTWQDVFCAVSFSAPPAWGASVAAGAGVLCRRGGESHGQEESAGQGLTAIISCWITWAWFVLTCCSAVLLIICIYAMFLGASWRKVCGGCG